MILDPKLQGLMPSLVVFFGVTNECWLASMLMTGRPVDWKRLAYVWDTHI